MGPLPALGERREAIRPEFGATRTGSPAREIAEQMEMLLPGPALALGARDGPRAPRADN